MTEGSKVIMFPVFLVFKVVSIVIFVSIGIVVSCVIWNVVLSLCSSARKLVSSASRLLL